MTNEVCEYKKLIFIYIDTYICTYMRVYRHTYTRLQVLAK